MHKNLYLYEKSISKNINYEQNQSNCFQFYRQQPNYFQQSPQQSTILSEISKKQQKQQLKKKRIRIYTSKNSNNKKGHWTIQQSLKYHYFLQLNSINFINKQRRKTDKIFKSMSNFIETRQAHQCRSHHQKIQKKWFTFSNILLNLRQQNFKSKDKQIIQKLLQSILGYQITNILDQQLLMNQQLLRQKLSQNGIQNHQQTQIKDNQMHENNNILQSECLLMSQTYQNHLKI